ncbi:MAG TPA: OmpA family protein [Myxococcaceae bacterium]|nr:OmpA family protein [Myxococcaceae bacterium]
MRLTATAVALVAVLSVPALGQDTSPFTRGIDVIPLKPTPTAGSGLFLDGAWVPYPKSVHAAVLLDLDGSVLALKYGTQKLGDLIPLRVDAHVLAAYQLNEKLELAGDLPVTLFQMDNFQLLRNQGYDQPGVSPFGLGDLRGLARWQLADPETSPIGLAAVGEVRVNIGNEASFLGDRAMVFGARAAAERSLGKLRVLANGGVLLRPFPGQFLNLWVRNQLFLGVGGTYRLPDLGPFHQVDGYAETNLLTPLEAPFTFLNADALPTPWDVVVGARARLFGPFHAELAVGRGVTIDGSYGRESYRVIFGLRYELDLDVRDRDHDGIPDGQDACPDEPEDKDGFEDSDGCPDPDNDHDGVADPDDQCPMDPGPKELDGCPDRDQDDVPDIVDKCPDQAGPAENEGCPTEEPAVVLETNRIRIKENILFETASAVIQPKSFSLLDEVYKVLKDHPEVGPVRIEGHTDNRGSRPYNLDLSNRRAQSVMKYLVDKGTAPKRLRFKGYGFDKPVATNATPLGRAKNRRVVFHILESGENEASESLQETGAQVEEGDNGPPEPGPDAGTPPPPQKNPPPPQKPPKK